MMPQREKGFLACPFVTEDLKEKSLDKINNMILAENGYP